MSNRAQKSAKFAGLLARFQPAATEPSNASPTPTKDETNTTAVETPTPSSSTVEITNKTTVAIETNQTTPPETPAPQITPTDSTKSTSSIPTVIQLAAETGLNDSTSSAGRYEDYVDVLAPETPSIQPVDSEKSNETENSSTEASYLDPSGLVSVTVTSPPIVANPVAEYGYTNDVGAIDDRVEVPEVEENGYENEDFSAAIKKPAAIYGGYIMDESEEDAKKKRHKASLEDSGYILQSDSSSSSRGGGADGDYELELYGVEDQPEAQLSNKSYLIDEQGSQQSGRPRSNSNLSFSSSYVSLDIEDPSIQLEAKFNLDMEELEPSDDDLRGAGLLRTSRSSSVSSLDRYSSKTIPWSPSSKASSFAAPSDSETSSAPRRGRASSTSSSYSSVTSQGYGTQEEPAEASGDRYVTTMQNTPVEDNGSYVVPVAAASNPPSRASSGSLRGSGNKNSTSGVLHPSLLTTPQAIQETLDSKGSWNERFQAIYDAPDSEAKYDAMHRLSLDFLGVAETYGRVIISELSLPHEDKSIKPINIGGVAGGSKYAARGLLFKFAVDVPPHYLYGSDEYAQKAAGHELKGLNNWSLNSEGLHFPLMALVRYCGFTLVALSMLPIGKQSLVYGSDDAGRTVHFDDDEIYEKMKHTAMNLNLKGHYLVADNSKMMYGPGDIEGHLGEDHLHYVLDYARVYPPAALVQGEVKEKSRCLFRLLRPELVSRFETPLSSDAFTAWGRMNSDVHNAEVRKATQFLVDDVIPKLAAKLSSAGLQQKTVYWRDVTRVFHLHGVNVRYMGLVRRVVCGLEKAAYEEALQYGPQNGEIYTPVHRWLLREMVARTIKSVLNQKWRELIKKYQRITPDRCIQEAIGVLNAFVEPQTAPASITFWNKTIRDLLNIKFPLALLEEEMALDEDGVPKVNLQKIVLETSDSEAWNFVFHRISELTGMHFAKQVIDTTIGFPHFGMLTAGDVLEIRSSVHQMSLVDFAYVMSKALIGLRQLSPSLATRLISLSIERLREAPSISLVVLRRIIMLKSYIVRTLKRMKWAPEMITAVAGLVDVALDGAQQMTARLPTDLATDAAMFLYEIHANSSESRAKILGYLQRAIECDPSNVRPYLECAKIYAFAVHPLMDENTRRWVDKTIEVAPNDLLVRLQLGLLLMTMARIFAGGACYPPPPDDTMSPIDEVLGFWRPVRDADPSLFRQLDLHLLSPKAMYDAADSNQDGRYELMTTTRLQSFSALVRVASILKCPDLNEVIKESLQEEFDMFLFRSQSLTTWTTEMIELVASCGPFEHIRQVYVVSADVIDEKCSEVVFGKFVAQCPNIEQLGLLHGIPNFKGEFLASLVNLSKLSVLDLCGTDPLEEGHVEAFFEALLADENIIPKLNTLTLPQTIGAPCSARLLHKIADRFTLKHLRLATWDEHVSEAIARHAPTLELLSLANTKGLILGEIKELLAKLPKLLIFDACATDLDDVVIGPYISGRAIHPSLEVFLSATQTYYLLTGAKSRKVRISTTFMKPIAFNLSIYPEEWPCLSMIQYTARRETFRPDRHGTNTFFTVGQSLIGHFPQSALLYGLATNHVVRCNSLTLGANSTLNWTYGPLKLAEVKIASNLPSAQFSWLYEGNLRNAMPNPNVAGIVRVLIQLPDMKDQHLLCQFTGSSSADVHLPVGFSINFWALAFLSFLRSLPS